jgi:hypothetical protein
MFKEMFFWLCLVALIAINSVSQPVTTVRTATEYYYPLGTTSYYAGSPNCGKWLEPDYTKGGCYTTGYYHLGFDMWNSSVAAGHPVYAMESGRVIGFSSNGWGTGNSAVLLTFSTASGTNYVSLYGHLNTSSIRVSVGDILNAGTKIGELGTFSPPHVHLSIWPNKTTIPTGPFGRYDVKYHDEPQGMTSPIPWITSTGSIAKCQNGGSAYYKPFGGNPVHPQGTLFTVKGDPAPSTVYVLWGGQTRGISSASLLYQLYGVGKGFDFRDVMQISMAEFNTYAHGAVLNSPLPGNGRNEPEGRLIQQWGTPEISIVTDNGKRRPFASAEAFLNLGYQFLQCRRSIGLRFLPSWTTYNILSFLLTFKARK